MNKVFFFRYEDTPSTSLNHLYVQICDDGKLNWNIDIPFISKWRFSKVSVDNLELLDQTNRVVGEIKQVHQEAYMKIGSMIYLQTRDPILFSPENGSFLADDWPQLNIPDLPSFTSDQIDQPLSFCEESSICWLNKFSAVNRKPVTSYSKVFGSPTEETRKWETIFGLHQGGLPSPDIYLLYLKDAYVLNGSLVFTSSGLFVGCTQQLGLTLGPYTIGSSSIPEQTDEFRFLKSLLEDSNVADKEQSSIPCLSQDQIHFLYSTTHGGFGHHLGQCTVSSYFLNRINQFNPDVSAKIKCLFRGGLSYESFRAPLFNLSLDANYETLTLPNGLVRVPKLVVPSSLTSWGNHWHGFGSLFHKIRDRATAKSTIADLDLSDYKGIYLSRRGFSRGTSNQDQFSSFMKDKGFFEYTPPGSLNLVDQIALLSRFGLVFSQYGSGAMNILFAKNNAHLVQPLCSMADGQSWDYSCAQIVGADYTYMFMPPDNPDANYFERRYTYDIEGIGNILDSIL